MPIQSALECVSCVHLAMAMQVVYCLRQGQAYVPFRQGKASILLKESLGGNCKTVVMLCMWLEDCFYDETVRDQHLTNKICIQELGFQTSTMSIIFVRL